MKELQITPSGIIEVVNLKVLGYSSKDPQFKTLNTPMIVWLLFTTRKCDFLEGPT
jgi:hypothetical protein